MRLLMLLLHLLFLLKLLEFLLLLRIQLVLLLLVFSIHLGVPCVWRRRTGGWRKVVRVNCLARARRVVRWPCRRGVMSAFLGGYNSVAGKSCRSHCGGNRRLSVIGRSPQLSIRACCLSMLNLCSYGRNMSFTRGSLFRRRRAFVDSPIAAIVADAGKRAVVDDCRVVDVVNFGDAQVVHGAVVKKVALLPPSSFITMAEVTVAIVDSAIETHNWAPITLVENKTASAPGPITWRPEQTDPRCKNPCARNPIVVVIVPGPIAGRPDIVVAGARWLLIDRQRRRSHRNG